MAWDFLKPFLMDRAMWVAAATAIVAGLNKLVGLGLDSGTIATLAGAFATYGVARVQGQKKIEANKE